MEYKLNNGMVALIDEEDFALVDENGPWYALKNKSVISYDLWYARNGKMVSMHRLIMDAPQGKTVDHINSDGLDNRRANLRLATYSEQERNSRPKRKRAAKHSQFKGVSWHVLKKPSGWVGGRWRAEIELPGRHRKIKYADTEIQAAIEYNKLALEYFGEHARLNTIPDETDDTKCVK